MRATAVGVLAIAVVFAGTPALSAEDAYWHRQAEGAAKLILNQGQKWPIDAPLRRGMENVRRAVALNIEAIRAGKATPAGYEALAAGVAGEVAGIVRDCRLEPAADRQLHVVLVDLLAGADALKGKVEHESPRAGAERLVKALNAYGTHFDHPGWEPIYTPDALASAAVWATGGSARDGR
jgi:hypothetical protein